MINEIRRRLFLYQDLKYRDFSSRIIPNIKIEKIIGVKVPVIRNIAYELYDDIEIDSFLSDLPHKYHEENILHGIILTLKYKDINVLLSKLDNFLIYVDNWAVTDVICPKLFKKYPDEVYKYVITWVKSDSNYVVRFGVVTLLQFYLDDNYNKEILKLVSSIKSDYYYVMMAIAWFYSYALIKKYDDTIVYFEDKLLDKWIHNKAIGKALDSYRISLDKKDYLKSLKIK